MPLKIIINKPAPVKLSQPLAPNSAAVPADVLQAKRALNRLGYYTPPKNIGITDIPDSGLFSAIKAFQKTLGIGVTGTLNPDDQTVETLNTELAKPNTGYYIWHTTGDTHVRGAHKELEGAIRSWETSPSPGEDFGCRCWAEPLGNSEADRKEAILERGHADFKLKPDLESLTDAPWFAIKSFNDVNKYLSIIDEESKRAKIDPNFVKAIVYIETTQGYYDRLLFGLEESIRPMNIRADDWKDLGYSRSQLQNPRLNIRAGIDLIKRIQSNYPNGSIAEIATLYNDLAAKRVSDYGGRVEVLTREKPWLKEK